jgi:hypothetical protein
MEYPEAVWVPLTPQGTMIEDTASGLKALTRTALNTDSAIPVDRYPQTVSNITNINYQRAADEVDLDITFQWVPEASGMINKFFINVACIMHITADTDNGVTFDNVQITMTKVGGQDLLYDEVFPTGLAQRTDVNDADLFIVAHPVMNQEFRVRAGNPINIRVQARSTIVGTNTSHLGICPFFPQQIPATNADVLFWAHTGIMFYISRDRKDG